LDYSFARLAIGVFDRTSADWLARFAPDPLPNLVFLVRAGKDDDMFAFMLGDFAINLHAGGMIGEVASIWGWAMVCDKALFVCDGFEEKLGFFDSDWEI
ncbi:MAG: hypothetical protein WCJ40_19690, partial [Planctomycetota bacterium]